MRLIMVAMGLVWFCGLLYTSGAHAKDGPKQGPCTNPLPLWCFNSGEWRVDPVIIMPSGRYTYDSRPDPGEIDPFPRGTMDVDIQMAGMDLSRVLAQDRFRVGFNGGVGITKYEGAGMVVLSGSVFFQVQNIYRFEVGWMMARSGPIERLEKERIGSMVRTSYNPYDKTAWFVGVSFPVVSDGIRKLLGKLKN